MLKALLSRLDPPRPSPLQGLFETLTTEIPDMESLDERLQGMAESLSSTAGLAGAMVAACDGDGVYAYASTEIGFADETRVFETFDVLSTRLDDESSWASLDPDPFALNERLPDSNPRILGRKFGSGLVIVSVQHLLDLTRLREALEKATPVLHWMLRDAVRIEAGRLQSELRQAEIRILSRPNPLDTRQIVRELKEVFCADEVTLLAQEQKRLYLSASTDEKLAAKSAIYDYGEGLTGEIFKHARPVCLRNALDAAEVSAKTRGKITRKNPVHPEGISELGTPIRMLAVPLKIGKKVRGVLRILRVATHPPFSEMEFQILQDHASLLAVAIHSSWQIHQAKAILVAETEAICISRPDVQDGKKIPRLTWVDPGAIRLFGKPKEQLEGSDGSKHYAVGEYERVRSFLRKSLDQGLRAVGPLLTKIRTKDRIKPVKISYRLLSSPFTQPPTHYTIAVIRDATEEERVIDLLDKRNLAYFRTDTEGRTIQTSKTELRFTGYDEEELLKLARKNLYVHERRRQELIEKVIAKRGELHHTLEHLKRRDGTRFFAEGVIRAVQGHGGLIVGFEGLYEDVTDRKALQAFLGEESNTLLKETELYDKLQENARLHMMFMTSVSHQLRAPLGALIEHMKNFQEGATDYQVFSQRLHYATRQAKVCSLLVSNFSYMDQILRGEPFDFTEVNFLTIANEVKHYFEHLLLEHQLTMRVSNQTFDPFLAVASHPELILQVFVNLVDNAIKYSNPGTKIIIEGVDGGALGPTLQISNLGLHIPVDKRRTLFERGTRLPQAKALFPGGTGLGLWLVKKILDTHKASIVCTTIKKDKVERTAFQISFPSSALHQHPRR